MDIEWIEPFQQDMKELYHQIIQFIAAYDVTLNSIQSIRRSYDTAYHWSQALPLTPTVWRWIDLYGTFKGITAILKTGMTYVNLLILKRNGPTVSLEDLPPEVRVLMEQTQRLIDLLHSQIPEDKPEVYSPSPTNELTFLPPAFLTTILRLTTTRARNVEMKPHSPDDWKTERCVPYYPDLTLLLLHYLATQLILRSESRTISIFHQQTPDVFEIHITAAIRMTPTFWARLVNELTFNIVPGKHCLERLYEIGGGIEPLTWDEGHGQGVIVRLPWAVHSPL